MVEGGGEGAELEPAGGADVGEAEEVDEEVRELYVRVRRGSDAAEGVVVCVVRARLRRWCVGRRHGRVGCVRVGCVRGVWPVGLASGVREEEERGEEEKDVGGDVDGAVRVWGDEGVRQRNDGDGGPECWDGAPVHACGVDGFYIAVLGGRIVMIMRFMCVH